MSWTSEDNKYKLHYKVLTKRNVEVAMAIGAYNDMQEQRYLEDLIEEQNEKLKEYGYVNDYSTGYVCHFFNSAFGNECTTIDTLDDAIQCLAIKEGVDLVKFTNGKIGYVAYYGTEENGFEILRRATEKDYEEDLY